MDLDPLAEVPPLPFHTLLFWKKNHYVPYIEGLGHEANSLRADYLHKLFRILPGILPMEQGFRNWGVSVTKMYPRDPLC